MRYTLDQPQEDVEMTFLEHLEALRWHLIRIVIAVFVFTIAAFLNKSFVFDTVFLGPSRLDFWTYDKMCEMSAAFGLGDALCVKTMGFSLINTAMAGQFTQHITMSLTIGFILAFPYALWEIWRFFKPALSAREKNYTRGVVFFGTIMFLLGILFGYYIITPITIQFLGNYTLSEELKNLIQLSDYIGTVAMTTFSIAIVFELPLVIYFLALGEIFSSRGMRQYRRHAILIILILSAVLTPSTDVLSMVLVSVPFVILYEMSIFVAALVERRRKKRIEYENSNS